MTSKAPALKITAKQRKGLLEYIDAVTDYDPRTVRIQADGLVTARLDASKTGMEVNDRHVINDLQALMDDAWANRYI